MLDPLPLKIATHCLHNRPIDAECKDCAHEIKHPRTRRRTKTGWPV